MSDDAELKGRGSTISNGRERKEGYRRLYRIAGVLALCLVSAMPINASEVAEPVFDIDIPVLNAAEALNRLAEQTGSVMLFPYNLAHARKANAVSGRYTLLEGLELLLRDTGLSGGLSDKRVVIIAEDEDTPMGKGGSMKKDEVKSKSLRSRIVNWFVVAGVAAASSATGAQSDATSAKTNAAETPAGLVEVTVTARRREESVQTVPAAITALSGETMDQIGASGFEDFVRMAPGLTMGGTAWGGLQNFNIRGIKTTPGPLVSQSPVSLYIDEMPTVDPFAPFGTVDLFLTDIDRIEVLRGPQGTLFGSGSLSGAIRVITKKAQLGETAGAVAAALESVHGGATGHRFEGMLNLPLGERFAARGVLYSRDIPGYVDNISRQVVDANGGDQVGGRLSLRGEPSDDFDVTASVIYQRDEYDDSATVFTDGGSGGPREWRSLVADKRRDEALLASLVVNKNFGWATLTSSTSYQDKRNDPAIDMDSLAALLGAPGAPGFFDTTSDSGAWIQEFRLTSNSTGALSYVLGLYYADWTQSYRVTGRVPVIETVAGLPYVLDTQVHADLREAALYGELAWRVTDKFELAAGLRAFRNEFKNSQRLQGLLNGFLITAFSVENTGESATPRFTATWRPSSNLTLYAQAAEGYRVGQTNAAVPTVPPTFDPDTLWNYEVGVKSTFWRGKARVNAAAFYIDWKDLQVGLPGPIGVYTDNAGSARSTGIEVEASILLTQNLEALTSFAWTNAELTEDVPNLVQPSGVIGVRDGDELPGSPDFTMSAALQYIRAFGAGNSYFVRLDYQFVGESLNSFTAVNASALGDYDLFNVSAGVEFGNGWEIGAFARNIANDDGTANVVFDPFGGESWATRVPPRTIGFSLRKTF